MDYVKNTCVRLLIVFAVLCSLFIHGCDPQLVDDTTDIEQLCPGKGDLAEVIEIFNSRRDNLKPITSSGDCKITWHEDDGKPHEEKPSIKFRFLPPDKLFLHGSTVLGEMIRLGTNSEQFWLRAKPKEISAYWWGSRADLEKCSGRLLINPDNLLNALGSIMVDDTWTLSHQGNWDILTEAYDGGLVRIIYIDSCDYYIKKIEYRRPGRGLIATVTPDNYIRTDDGLETPTSIGITVFSPDGLNTIVELKLRNPKVWPEKDQKPAWFERANTRGIKHVYELNGDCDFIEQP